MIRSKYLDSFVSRETSRKLYQYHQCLMNNNQKMSLISKSTEREAYIRHYEDSAQIIEYISNQDENILDIGTGAGLPGIILDLIKVDKKLDFHVNLLEKSPKKCKFLKQAIRLLDLDIKIHNANVNMLRNKNYSVVTARAFKPLGTFLDILDNSNIKFKKLILLKGEKYENEILDAEKYWEIKCELHDSITNKASKVFVINSVKRINA